MEARKRSTTPSKSIAPRATSPSIERRATAIGGRKISLMRRPSEANKATNNSKSSGRSPSGTRPDSAASAGDNASNSSLRVALEHYEAENKKLQRELENSQDTVRAVQQKLVDQEKVRQQLSKKLFNTDKSLRFEKMATEGLKKKSGLWEAEHNVLLEEKNTILIEQKRLQARIDHLQRCLNSDRAKRLKEMHENEKLKRDNEQLRRRVAELEEDNVRSNSSLLEKLQELETAFVHAEFQQRTIDAQAEEMINLAREICLLQEKQQTLINRSVRLEDFASTRARERDKYESEVKRLRTEILSVSLYQGDKSMAYDGAKALSKPRLKSIKSSGLSTRGTNVSPSHSAGGLVSSPSQSHSHSYSSGLVAMLPIENNALSEARSTSAKILRSAARKHRNDYNPTEDQLVNYVAGAGRSSVGGSVATNTAGSSGSVHSVPAGAGGAVAGSSSSSSARPHHLRPVTEYATVVGGTGGGGRHGYGYGSPTGNSVFGTLPRSSSTAESATNDGGRRLRSRGSPSRVNSPGNANPWSAGGDEGDKSRSSMANKKKVNIEELSEMSLKPKSMFVGSGLGLRNPSVPDFNPQGSAKQMLKKIMTQFEEDYGKV